MSGLICCLVFSLSLLSALIKAGVTGLLSLSFIGSILNDAAFFFFFFLNMARH